jgi:hypothetical protein
MIPPGELLPVVSTHVSATGGSQIGGEAKRREMPNAESAPGNGASGRVAIHPVPDIIRSFGGLDASRVGTSVRGNVVNLAARSADILQLPVA